MTIAEAKAEVYLMALRSMSKTERNAVIHGLLNDPKLREDILDLAIIRERQSEPTKPFREYLDERRSKGKK
jgi:hypothetical protein